MDIDIDRVYPLVPGHAGSPRHYISLPGGVVRPADLLEWAAWFERTGDIPFEDGGRIVAKTDVDWFEVFKAGGPLPAAAVKIHVSTIFMGLDHSFPGSVEALLFETMIFGGPHDGYQDRYSTVEEARAGHQAAVAMHTTPLSPEA